MEPSTKSHLVFVDSLPEDVIQIKDYVYKDTTYTFENLYYSPSLDLYYQAPKIKYRVITPGKTNISCRTDSLRTIKLSIKKLRKSMGLSVIKKNEKNIQTE